MIKNQENKNKIGITNNKMQGMKFTQKKVKTKDLGNISLDLSKEEEIMRKTPGLMENSMIENITTMNSIFAQKQSERLMLNNFNQLNINDSQNNTINNSSQTFNALVEQNSNMSGENPLDMAVIIKDSSEVKEEEEKEKQKEKEKKKRRTKKKSRKKKKKLFNKTTILIIFLLVIIALLIIGLIMTYVSVAKDRELILIVFFCYSIH